MRGIPILGLARCHVPTPASLRRRIVAFLKRHGELATTTIVGTLAGAGTSSADVEAALCELEAAGIVTTRRRPPPVYHGCAVRREWSYWRLAR